VEELDFEARFTSHAMEYAIDAAKSQYAQNSIKAEFPLGKNPGY